VSSRPGSGWELRASDADRERVVALLTEAAADGRLTQAEHAERTQRAFTARTLGDLVPLTADLAEPSAQPIRLDTGRAITAFRGSQRRDGRWVVPPSLTATAVAGEVVLDFRAAVLPSGPVALTATVVGGTLSLIVPDGMTVRITRTTLLGRPSGRAEPEPPPAPPGGPVIEVRAMVLAGRIKTITPRRPPRWRRGSRRGASG
jgi:hypothetical protein